MAENTILKIRCAGIDMADPIISQAGIATATWEEQPLTLRDDELSLVEADPTETDIYSHENDTEEDYDAVGNGIAGVGSFIKATYTQLLALQGGTVSGTGDAAMFLKSGKKLIFNKAVRFRLKNGGYIIIPNGKGYVNLNANLGATDGRLKYPFRIKALATADWDCDIILKLTPDAEPTP